MKAIIVRRVSTQIQELELQDKDCLELAKKKNLEVIKNFSEVASAGKSKQKLIYDAEQLAVKEKACIIVWKYDRTFRNKKDFVNFMLRFYELYNLKVYSVQEEWVNMLWEIIESFDFEKIPYPYNEAIKEQLKLNWRLMIKIIGKIAEDEIKDKGARVKLAVRKIDGEKTKSYKGNVWGRKSIINNRNIIRSVENLYNEGKSIRDISGQVYYWDKNHNQRKLSVGAVHKIISQFSTKNEHVKEDVQTLKK